MANATPTAGQAGPGRSKKHRGRVAKSDEIRRQSRDAIAVIRSRWGNSGDWLPADHRFRNPNALEWPTGVLSALARLSAYTLGEILLRSAKDLMASAARQRIKRGVNKSNHIMLEDIESVIASMSAPGALGAIPPVTGSQHDKTTTATTTTSAAPITATGKTNDTTSQAPTNANGATIAAKENSSITINQAPTNANPATKTATNNTSDTTAKKPFVRQAYLPTTPGVLVPHGMGTEEDGDPPPLYPAHWPPHMRPRQPLLVDMDSDIYLQKHDFLSAALEAKAAQSKSKSQAAMGPPAIHVAHHPTTLVTPSTPQMPGKRARSPSPDQPQGRSVKTPKKDVEIEEETETPAKEKGTNIGPLTQLEHMELELKREREEKAALVEEKATLVAEKATLVEEKAALAEKLKASESKSAAMLASYKSDQRIFLSRFDS